ncbi:MAG TPA: hypothetical protein VFR46_03275 [Actinomycetes bacterium]|nr:hypothetical protein [Actinomycetes bacterium]
MSSSFRRPAARYGLPPSVLIVFPLGPVDDGPFWSTVNSLWFGMAFYLLTFVSVSLVVIVRRRRETTS